MHITHTYTHTHPHTYAHIQGVLEVSKSSSPKGWKPCLFVLKKHTDAQRSTLDYYKDTKKRWQKQVSGERRGGWDGRGGRRGLIVTEPGCIAV